MALSSATSCPSLYRLYRNSLTIPRINTSVSFKSSPSYLNRGRCISIRASSVAVAPTSGGLAPAISLSDNALNHLNKMKAERNEELCLRIGVKQGGCSGMSYTMEFESREASRPDDSIIEYNGFVIASSSLFCSKEEKHGHLVYEQKLQINVEGKKLENN